MCAISPKPTISFAFERTFSDIRDAGKVVEKLFKSLDCMYYLYSKVLLRNLEAFVGLKHELMKCNQTEDIEMQDK